MGLNPELSKYKDPKSGKFLPGNPGGPGGGIPYHKKILDLREAMFDAVTQEDIRDVMYAVLGKAKGGDPKCATLILNYMLGKPEQLVTVTAVKKLDPQQMQQALDRILGINTQVMIEPTEKPQAPPEALPIA